MTNQDKLNLMKDRYNKLISNGKNIKSAGVVKKLARRIRNMKQ